MPTKLKVVRAILATREAAETTVAEVCSAQIEREKLIAKRDAKIARITEEYASDLEEQGDTIANGLTLLEQWADLNPAEFGDARSTIVGGARLGFRLGTPKVEATGKLTFKAIIAELKKKPAADPLAKKYLRVKTELDKESILATGRLTESNDPTAAQAAAEELAAIGVEITQGESFAPELPHKGGAKSAAIDEGLTILSLIRVPGVVYELEEIAGMCGCSDSAILEIERRALRKLRRGLESLGISAADFADAALSNHQS